MTPRPDEIKTQEPEGTGTEPFLSRWSRRKEEALRSPPEPAPESTADPEGPAPELPPLDTLTPESDYRAFFHPKVNEDVRRAALKKLFSDPRFNVMDGLDVYIDDYSKSEPIPAAMLAGLRQAQNILQWAKEDGEKRAQDKLQQDKLQQQASAPALEPSAALSVPVPGSEVAVNAPDSVPAPTDGTDGPAKA
jgi:uncharacterized protein DUF3306